MDNKALVLSWKLNFYYYSFTMNSQLEKSLLQIWFNYNMRQNLDLCLFKKFKNQKKPYPCCSATMEMPVAKEVKGHGDLP